MTVIPIWHVSFPRDLHSYIIWLTVWHFCHPTWYVSFPHHLHSRITHSYECLFVPSSLGWFFWREICAWPLWRTEEPRRGVCSRGQWLWARLMGAACLQCVAACCSVLRCVAMSERVWWALLAYSVLQRVAVCCSVLQCVAVCCSVLQCGAVCYNVCERIWWAPLVCSVLQCVAICCSVLQCIAVCCSVLQRVVVCCNDYESI